MTYQPAVWKGSEKTADAVRQVIAQRWGDEEAEHYDPTKNCFEVDPFSWSARTWKLSNEKNVKTLKAMVMRDVNRSV